MKFRINIILRATILDPQGEAIRQSLKNLSFKNITKVTQGKIIDLDIDEKNPEIALKEVIKMTEELLVNDLIEDYSIERTG